MKNESHPPSYYAKQIARTKRLFDDRKNNKNKNKKSDLTKWNSDPKIPTDCFGIRIDIKRT